MENMRITVIIENTAQGPGLLAEHGLAFLIEHEGRNVLLDCGQGGALINNARNLGIPLHEIDALILSHGHYDHAGGAVEALKTDKSVLIYAHPAAFKHKFMRKNDGTVRDIGMPYLASEAIQDKRFRLVATVEPIAIFQAFTVTGPIPRQTDFEDTGGQFFLDETCTKPDPLEDDQSVFFNTDEGVVVILGCAHSGVINTLHYIRQLTGNRPIRAVIGGMHLINASDVRIKRTIEELKRMSVKQLSPAHCTGMRAIVALWNEFPGQCRPCPVGTVFEFS
jgi:7,8-dihydropterin-6-yl-methyl-4-(beta-D-ribofuranosyl)aminobenzene 5'-phosphate synthase